MDTNLSSWLSTPGYPVLSVSADDVSGPSNSISLSQQPIQSWAGAPEGLVTPADMLWPLPLQLRCALFNIQQPAPYMAPSKASAFPSSRSSPGQGHLKGWSHLQTCCRRCNCSSGLLGLRSAISTSKVIFHERSAQLGLSKQPPGMRV